MQSHRAESESAIKFLDFFKSEGQYENALIIASGPSSTHWTQQTKDEHFVIVCNSVIKNTDLMEHFQPKALVFGDPIFHFGPSSYAANFRAQLMSSAQNFSYSTRYCRRISNFKAWLSRSKYWPFSNDFYSNIFCLLILDSQTY